jgi:hypothetical protein
MYGIDRNTKWCDYDLTSAYTTVMSWAGHRISSTSEIISSELNKLNQD